VRTSVGRGVAVLACVIGLVATACGGGDSSDPQPSSSAVPTTSVSDDSAPPDTAVADTVATVIPTSTSTTMPVTPWREDVPRLLADVFGAPDGSGAAVAAATKWFGLPVGPSTPDDAVLADAYLVAKRNADGGFDVRWEFAFASATGVPDSMEQAIVSSFSDPRFEPGARVTSTLDAGTFVTLNYAPSEAGVAEGWTGLSFGIGPETNLDGPTGRQNVEVRLERTVATIADLELPTVLTSWIDQFPPNPDGTELVHFGVDLVDLTTDGVWLDVRFSAPSERFGDLVAYYSRDWSAGDLEYGPSMSPGDLATLDYFVAGSFMKFAGHTALVTVTRSLDAPAEPAIVQYEVRIDEPGT